MKKFTILSTVFLSLISSVFADPTSKNVKSNSSLNDETKKILNLKDFETETDFALLKLYMEMEKDLKNVNLYSQK